MIYLDEMNKIIFTCLGIIHLDIMVDSGYFCLVQGFRQLGKRMSSKSSRSRIQNGLKLTDIEVESYKK